LQSCGDLSIGIFLGRAYFRHLWRLSRLIVLGIEGLRYFVGFMLTHTYSFVYALSSLNPIVICSYEFFNSVELGE
jgi:hypothetical protein